MREALRAGFVERLGLERLGAELHKLLGEPQAVRSLAMLRDWGLLAPVHPALATDRDLLDRVARTREAWARYGEIAPEAAPEAAEPQWIALGWALPTDERRARARLTGKVRGRTGRWVAGPVRVRAALARLAPPAGAATAPYSAQAISIMDLEPSERVAVIANGDESAYEAVCWWEREGQRIVPAVGGHALMAAGVAPGRRLGAAVAAARAAAWDGADAAGQLAAGCAAAESAEAAEG